MELNLYQLLKLSSSQIPQGVIYLKQQKELEN